MVEGNTTSGSSKSRHNTAIVMGLLIGFGLGLAMGGFFTRPQPLQQPPQQPLQQTVRINGHEIIADARSEITIEGESEVFNPINTKELARSGNTKGLGVTTTEKGIANTGGELPVIDLDGASASGGWFSWQFEGLRATNTYLLYIFSGICGVVGAVLLYFGLRGLAFSLFALSAAFGIGGFLMETYPLALAVIVLVAAAAGGYFLWSQWKQKRKSDALKVVAGGIEKSPLEVQKVVKANIEEEAGSALKAVKSTIMEVKAEINSLKTKKE